MADQPPSDKDKGKEAMVGVKGDVKILQQLSSSGQAAQKKRIDNQIEKGMNALGAAIQGQFRPEECKDQGKSGK
jgi:hypothetical protein